MTTTIAAFYADWAGYNRRIATALRSMSQADLALTVAGADYLPVWAIASHVAGARVYWLCHVLGEPGAEATPFRDPEGLGWEDDLATVRTADEIADAYASSWRIVERCLEHWTPEVLGQTIRRKRATGWQVHSRESILLRLITHEAYHVGEIGLTLGAHGRPPIDLWPAADWLEGVGAT